MYYGFQQQRPAPSSLGTRGFAAEVAGRDRVRYFRRPVEPHPPLGGYVDIGAVRFAASAPSTPLPLGPIAPGSFPRGSRPHHLPALQKRTPKRGAEGGRRTRSVTPTESLSAAGTATQDAGMQTVYRENEAQTLPYTPAYRIPEGGDPNPQVLGLRDLTWGDGLPAGMEEVELIQRIRRRRAVEASLPPETDAKSAEVRQKALFELEEQERKEKEEHMEKIRQRRLDGIREALERREAAREESNRRRLEAVKAQKLADLRRMIERTELRRIAAGQKSMEKGTSKMIPSPALGMSAVDPIDSCKGKKDLIESYSKYGVAAALPQIPSSTTTPPPVGPSDHFRHYDVRPTMLTMSEGIQELESTKIPRIQRLPQNAFIAPENYAINSLPTLYQRREATRVVDALEYVNARIHKSESPEENIHVLELYRATPRIQRPDTPELELEGDAEKELEEACVLLQRLLRGRAVQNDFFDGKERCRGLIEELQAASNAKYAARSLEEKSMEEAAKRHEEVADSLGDEAQGDIISETLDYLFHELTRQQDLGALEELRREAEAVRADREVKEAELRTQERILHDKEAVQYTAYIRAIDDVIECYAHELYTSSAEECAMEEAIEAECKRLEKLSSSSPSLVVDPEATETLVCDMLDNFVLPTVVDMVCLKSDELDRKAPAAAAVESSQSVIPQK
ncbi:CFAP91 domain [Trypanosoma melophagium]|uniref:CFAP91 domain n=1 Tax=Trypanosoma melophagium TaxID=715481 RepID=UPI00351A5C26|nr:CFAP91 domain [Trypanosoma melophagium]